MFENRYYVNRALLSEFFRKYSIGPRLSTMIVCVLVYASTVIFSIYCNIFEEMRLLLILIGFIYIALSIFPIAVARVSIRMSIKQHDGVLPETVITFDDDIRLTEGAVQVTVEYRKITKVRRLAHSYALFTGKRAAVLVREDGFTKGTFEGFKVFLRSKRPDLTIPE